VNKSELKEARRVLAALLVKIEAGELEASRSVVDKIRGSVATLDTLSIAARDHLR
jgi:hypothetical protein